MSEPGEPPLAPLRIESHGVGIDDAERSRSRSLRGLGIWSAAVIVVAVLSLSLANAAFCGFTAVPCFGVVVTLFALALALTQERPALGPGVVFLEEGVLTVERRPSVDIDHPVRRIPIADIVQGFWEEPDLCHLATRGGEVVMVRAGPDEGGRLLRAAGVTAAERVLRVPLASAASRVPGGRLFCVLAAGLGVFIVGIATLVTCACVWDLLRASAPSVWRSAVDVAYALGFLAVSSAGAYAFVGLLRRREAVVGTDGILYRTSFRRRFLPLAEVTRALPDSRGVRVERREGRALVLPLRRAGDPPLSLRSAAPGKYVSEAEARRNVLLDRIQEAMAARRGGAVAEPSLALLDRRGRPIGAWREELGKLLGAAGGYRATAITAADLGHVVADPAAPAARRIAAAVALSSSAPDEARRRARIAAQACADERLARALERAAEGEIEAALVEEEEAAAEAPTRTRRT